jgi:hypothetical protein
MIWDVFLLPAPVENAAEMRVRISSGMEFVDLA